MAQLTAHSSLTTGHIGLNVTDLDRSRAFYQRVFGFELFREGTESERRFAFLGRDGALAVTLWQQSKGSFATGTPGLHHLSFQVASVEAVREVEQVLRELGAEFAYEGVVPHGEGADSGGIFFTDPDGIRLEVFTAHGAHSDDGSAPSGTAPTCGFF
ncbi:VOC family protein [Kitasatospora kifunensis]|uniref:Catechol 2,3-dioxygenase-like lactoylglutathione lyase family enzyme n=1 Tax=Kitasatospora kifunensis TaxID=58351 RepID=A0A7W7R6R3_KITKI|nr:VOC family protein [Kitasatospora kifunensis]MBB4926437.1 catechol 2,3-dioxygenase-like lactoylglutathione lyase family enzyme [Kitasatospora kifunensis]